MQTPSPPPSPPPAEGAPAASLLQLRPDRRLGHEWDDWDGDPLAADGVFREGTGLFFGLAVGAVAAATALALGVVWLTAPRLEALAGGLPRALTAGVAAGAGIFLAWLAAVALTLRSGRNRIPVRLAEGKLVPWLMLPLERVGVWCGLSRDRVGNSLVRVFNTLSAARARPGTRPEDLLVLLPRCLSKSAMQGAMDISARYGVPLFVAARGRHARQMIAMRRPKGVVAVACERDLVSGIHDVAGRLPVLGTTLALPDGPCKNTVVNLQALEEQVRTFLGLDAGAAAGPVASDLAG